MPETKDKPVSTSREIVSATIKPEVQRIELGLPSIKVTVSGTHTINDREYFYSATESSGAIGEDITTDLGIKLEPHEQEQLLETIEHVKTFISKVEFGIGLTSECVPYLSLKFERSPQKTTRKLSKS